MKASQTEVYLSDGVEVTVAEAWDIKGVGINIAWPERKPNQGVFPENFRCLDLSISEAKLLLDGLQKAITAAQAIEDDYDAYVRRQGGTP